MVFDLGGISHFTKQNQFPVRWSESESAQLLNTCYQPTQWDIYWRLEPCDFVMRKIEREEKLFGTRRSWKTGHVRSFTIHWLISNIGRRSCGIFSPVKT
jgi:hypothetical protein